MTKSLHSDRYAAMLAILIQARKDANLAQTELATKLGKPQSYVSKVERGERRIDVVEFCDFSIAANADPAALFSRIIK